MENSTLITLADDRLLLAGRAYSWASSSGGGATSDVSRALRAAALPVRSRSDRMDLTITGAEESLATVTALLSAPVVLQDVRVYGEDPDLEPDFSIVRDRLNTLVTDAVRPWVNKVSSGAGRRFWEFAKSEYDQDAVDELLATYGRTGALPFGEPGVEEARQAVIKAAFGWAGPGYDVICDQLERCAEEIGLGAYLPPKTRTVVVDLSALYPWATGTLAVQVPTNRVGDLPVGASLIAAVRQAVEQHVDTSKLIVSTE
jgi:hypothetical protein